MGGQDEQARISPEERSRALEELARHRAAGRLDSHDYEDRRGRVGDALTLEELNRALAHLPPAASDSTGGRDSPGQPDHLVRAEPVAQAGLPAERKADSPSDSARRGAAMGLFSMLALVLFFQTGSWLWFLMIPVVGMLWTLVTGND